MVAQEGPAPIEQYLHVRRGAVAAGRSASTSHWADKFNFSLRLSPVRQTERNRKAGLAFGLQPERARNYNAEAN